ncbi:MAG: UDP-N-acetylglucosamine 2-epimerase (hydrolyzing) [Bacteroidia bacterium]|nr:UDP-N-acetylglucosamine 2-epimerase (hydrolyzing) [Bacteroidia bacterium]HRO07531.1 UDP-N-acetylglucosamine 2-epimerase [Saprospiraceae bacterium]HRP40814.1 UDP-N-acetylglucosamine 2-epimerase [Saprospiraceae bacterium]
MRDKRKICIVVTARPSYSRIKTAIEAVNQHPDLELQLVVTSSALLDRYGTAVNYIEKDGFSISAKVFNVLEGENLTAQAKTTGLGIIELSSVFERLQPDAVVTIADRFETMATAIAACYMNIPLIHIQGGEVTGNIDEKVRHAITKLADLHLVASENAKNRVIKMGEFEDRVINTGCPSIDIAAEVLQEKVLDFNPFEKYGGVGKNINYYTEYIVVMQHPVTTEYTKSRIQIEETLKAIHKINMPTFWFWPNVDAGADGTSKGIRAYREMYNLSNIHFFKNMEPTDFIKLLYFSKCLVGNSSVGIRECSFLGVPVVNIGSRQEGRQRGMNVIDVDYSVDEIYKATQQHLLHGKYNSDYIYGKGNSGKIIANILSSVPLTFNKKISY